MLANEKVLKVEDKMSSSGVITSRKCPLCGHHEVGYTTKDGVFHSLKPGTVIQILNGSQISVVSVEDRADHKGVAEEEHLDRSRYRVWIPDPLRGDKRFRLKYGVMVKETSFAGKISGEAYRLAYLEKLHQLIEKEVSTPIAVIFDRFFTAPHLAAGNPRQIAEAIWRELDEIRRPVLLVSEWLEKQDEETVSRMIHPIAKEELVNQSVSEAEEQKELEELSLEEFLGLL